MNVAIEMFGCTFCLRETRNLKNRVNKVGFRYDFANKHQRCLHNFGCIKNKKTGMNKHTLY